MIKSLVATCLVAVSAIISSGQTSADLGAKYPVVTAYEVLPGMQMRARYDSSGQVCEMTVEKRHATEAKIDLGASISPELVRTLIDELAPELERGKPMNIRGFGKHEDNSEIFGDLVITKFDFENISAKTIGSASAGESMVLIIRWNKRTCGPSPNDTAFGPHSQEHLTRFARFDGGWPSLFRHRLYNWLPHPARFSQGGYDAPSSPEEYVH